MKNKPLEACNSGLNLNTMGLDELNINLKTMCFLLWGYGMKGPTRL